MLGGGTSTLLYESTKKLLSFFHILLWAKAWALIGQGRPWPLVFGGCQIYTDGVSTAVKFGRQRIFALFKYLEHGPV
jgi:hypothetical protein